MKTGTEEEATRDLESREPSEHQNVGEWMRSLARFVLLIRDDAQRLRELGGSRDDQTDEAYEEISRKIDLLNRDLRDLADRSDRECEDIDGQ